MLRKNIFRLPEASNAADADFFAFNTPSGSPARISRANLFKGAGLPTQIKYVSSKADFPAAVGGVITLVANTTYILTLPVNLTGDRIVMAASSSLEGLGLNRSVLSSTGLTGAIVTFTSSTQLTEMAFNIGANQVGARCLGTSVDVNLLCYQVAFITTAATAKGIELPSGSTMGVMLLDTVQTTGTGIGVDIGGAANSIACTNCGYGSATAIVTRSGSVINTRIRNSFVLVENSVFNFISGTTVPNESILFSNCAFSGTASITGINTPDKVKIQECTGPVSNNPSVGTMRMAGNTTATTIGTAGTYTKALGTTAGGTLNRYTHTPNNRLVYNGLQAGLQKVTVIASLTQAGGGNPVVSIGVAFNGTLQVDSTFDSTTDGSGRAEVISTAFITNVQQNGFFELFVTNKTNTSAVTVTQFTMIVEVL